jgi:hypothetical protein
MLLNQDTRCALARRGEGPRGRAAGGRGGFRDEKGLL